MASTACGQLPEALLLACCLRLVTSTENAGFTHTRTQPLHVLAHVVSSYIALLGTATNQHAELSRRQQPNLADACAALEGLGFARQTISRWVEDCGKGDWALAHNAEGSEELSDMSALLNRTTARPIRQHQTYRPLSSAEAEALNEMAVSLDSPSPDQELSISEEPAIPAKASSPILSESESDEEFDSDEEIAESDRQAKRLARAKQKEKRRSLSITQNPPMLVPDDDPSEDTFECKWRNRTDVPSYIPAFLPPFPGFEKEVELDEVTHRPREDHPNASNQASETNVKQALAKKVHTHQFTGGAHLDPWKHVVPYDKSALTTQDSAITTAEQALPLLEDVKRPQLTPDQMAERSSLTAFFEAHHELAKRGPSVSNQISRTFPKRRQAASYLSSLKSHGQDSLFGAIKPQSVRSAKRTAGWLPYPLRLAPTDPDPILHPFVPEYTILNTMSTPIQSTEAFAPLFVPRIRNIYPQLLRGIQSSGMAAGTGPLFTRTTRIAPPGPLGPAGESWPYLLAVVEDFDPKDLAKVQAGKGVQFGFDWTHRDPADSELPKSLVNQSEGGKPPAHTPAPSAETPLPTPTVVTINGSEPRRRISVNSRSQSPAVSTRNERASSTHRSTPSISFFSSSAQRGSPTNSVAPQRPSAASNGDTGMDVDAPLQPPGAMPPPPQPPSAAAIGQMNQAKPKKLQIKLPPRPATTADIGGFTNSQIVASPLPETPIQVKEEEAVIPEVRTPLSKKISFKFGGR